MQPYSVTIMQNRPNGGVSLQQEKGSRLLEPSLVEMPDNQNSLHYHVEKCYCRPYPDNKLLSNSENCTYMEVGLEKSIISRKYENYLLRVSLTCDSDAKSLHQEVCSTRKFWNIFHAFGFIVTGENLLQQRSYLGSRLDNLGLALLLAVGIVSNLDTNLPLVIAKRFLYLILFRSQFANSFKNS